jgi:predicted nucleotidyltransferase
MTLEGLKSSGSIIFESISGSRAYGLDTATSDTDIRGVFILPKEHYYSLDYIGQVNNETNDIVYYELNKFIDLLAKNNPNILELLNVPDACILYKHPVFNRIKQDQFLSKLCKNTFANYAFTQIKKARGLNKKIVNPVEKERKTVEDFCYIRAKKQSIKLKDYLEKHNLNANHCGLVKLANMKDCYNLFYNPSLDFQGVARPLANEVCLSSVPKTEQPLALLYFNRDGYSTYCKKYKAYWDWVANRNEVRYTQNKSHNKNYDAKNMMHTFRLLHMAKEIGLRNEILVKRPDRAFLLAIKNAEFEYDTLVQKAELLREELDEVYKTSSLMETPQRDFVNRLAYDLRTDFYNNF